MTVKMRILAACRELSSRQGFYNMSVDELAAQAGISKRTLYRYFHGKEEVIAATIDEFMSTTAETINRLVKTEKDLSAVLYAIFNHLYTAGRFIINPITLNDLQIHYPDLWQKIDIFRAQYASRIISQLASNKLAPFQKIDPRIISAAILASLQAVLNPYFILENGFTFEEVADQLSRLMVAILT